MARLIGITTTIPQEIVYAAGAIPVDLNNRFITNIRRKELIDCAQRAGFGRNICSWIKGIYGAVKSEGIREVIAVTCGDCSNTQALMETLQYEGIKVVPFAYPYGRDKDILKLALEKLRYYFGVNATQVSREKERLDQIRHKLKQLDALTWQTQQVSGFDNHQWLVTSSDFEGDPAMYEKRLDTFLVSVQSTLPKTHARVRLGYVGVPSVFDDMYAIVEGYGATILFNEVQRQFAMLPSEGDTLEDVYLRYTYPYDIFARVEDIKKEIFTRKLNGIIHYAQSFCFRQIEDIIIRKMLEIPVLTLEADAPGPVDARTKMRIEAFIEMLSMRNTP